MARPGRIERTEFAVVDTGTPEERARAERFFAMTQLWATDALSKNPFGLVRMSDLSNETFTQEQIATIERGRTVTDSAMRIPDEGRFASPEPYVFTRLFTLISLARVEAIRAEIERRGGAHDAATERTLRVARLGVRLQEDGPGIMGYMVGVVIEGFAVDSVRNRPGIWNDPRLDTWLISASLAPPSLEPHFRREYAFALRALENLGEDSVVEDGELRSPNVWDRFAANFLVDRAACARLHESNLRRIVAHGSRDFWESGCPSDSNLVGSRFVLDPFEAELRKGAERLAGILVTRANLQARARLALLSIRASRRRFERLEDLVGEGEERILVNPMTGERWELDPAARSIRGAAIIECKGTRSPTPLAVSY